MGMFDRWLGGKKKQGSSLPPDLEAVFEKLRSYLNDEAAQVNRLPEKFRTRIVANVACDRTPGGEGQFGRTVTNPIPVNGPLGQVIYLSALRANNQPILFHRLGSFSEVDIFETVSADGAVWDLLFLSLYYPRRSRVAPQGYALNLTEPLAGRFYGATTRVEPFPHNLYEAVRNFTVRFVGIPLPNKHVRELLATKQFVPPETHRLRIDELVRSRMQLALTDRDMPP